MNIKSYIWIIPFLSFLCGYGVLQYLLPVYPVETPLLIGKTVDMALPIVTELNLNVRFLHYIEDADVPAGTIVSQIPAAYQMVKPHQSIFIVLSKKPSFLYASEMRNQTDDSIKNQLLSLGITAQMYYVPSHYPAHHCVAQIPAAGEPLQGNSMMFYISDATVEKIIWPNFMGKRVEDVVEFLRSYDIETDIVHTYRVSSAHRCTDCLVVDQRPLPGSIITLNMRTHPLRVQLQIE